jgi:hypothetical protein
MTATAQKFVIKTLAEKKLKNLPEGSLYWRIETFPTLFHAEAAGKVWLFTLGPPVRLDSRRQQGGRDRPRAPARCT